MTTQLDRPAAPPATYPASKALYEAARGFTTEGVQHAGRFQEADKSDGGLAQVFHLSGRVHAQRMLALLAVVGLAGRGKTVQPVQRFLDLVVLEPHRRELARQLRMVGAGVRAPVGLVEINQDIEHREGMIAQRPGAPGCE